MKTIKINEAEVLGNIGTNLPKLKKAFPTISMTRYMDDSGFYIKKMKELLTMEKAISR